MKTIIEVINHDDDQIEVKICEASRINVMQAINMLITTLEENLTLSRETILSLLEDFNKKKGMESK